MASNGRLPKSDLAPIPGGELRKDAAAAWNARGGPADAGLVPTGPRSSYRTLQEQHELFAELGPGIAAEPGTSNHGWGVAIDVPSSWMWAWLQEHGDPFGWDKTEAFHVAWHWNFVGGVSFPTFVTLKRGVLDPQGKAIEHSLHSLGFEEVQEVRLGKYVDLQLRDGDRDAAAKRLDEMCRQLLANGVIEDYRYEIVG